PLENRVDAFIDEWIKMAPRDAPRLPASAQRSVVGFCMALSYPRRYIFLKTTEIGQALGVLDPTFAWSPSRLTGSDVARVEGLVSELMERLEKQGYEPRDRLDAQGFLWVAAKNLNTIGVMEGDVNGYDTDADPSDDTRAMPVNSILYGPPGTGKTF